MNLDQLLLLLEKQIEDVRNKRDALEELVQQLKQVRTNILEAESMLQGYVSRVVKRAEQLFNAPLSTAQDLSRKTIVEAAIIILRESGVELHFEEIARIARDRGYRGVKDSWSATRGSFQAVLNNKSKASQGQIEQVRDGVYKFREKEVTDEQHTTGGPGAPGSPG